MIDLGLENLFTKVVEDANDAKSLIPDSVFTRFEELNRIAVNSGTVGLENKGLEKAAIDYLNKNGIDGFLRGSELGNESKNLITADTEIGNESALAALFTVGALGGAAIVAFKRYLDKRKKESDKAKSEASRNTVYIFGDELFSDSELTAAVDKVLKYRDANATYLKASSKLKSDGTAFKTTKWETAFLVNKLLSGKATPANLTKLFDSASEVNDVFNKAAWDATEISAKEEKRIKDNSEVVRNALNSIGYVNKLKVSPEVSFQDVKDLLKILPKDLPGQELWYSKQMEGILDLFDLTKLEKEDIASNQYTALSLSVGMEKLYEELNRFVLIQKLAEIDNEVNEKED